MHPNAQTQGFGIQQGRSGLGGMDSVTIVTLVRVQPRGAAAAPQSAPVSRTAALHHGPPVREQASLDEDPGRLGTPLAGTAIRSPAPSESQPPLPALPPLPNLTHGTNLGRSRVSCQRARPATLRAP